MDKMDAFKAEVILPLRQLAQQHQLVISLAFVVLVLVVPARALRPSPADGHPPMMRDTIPYISNTYQFLMQMDKFLKRAV